MLGPVFVREAVTAPRRWRHYASRSVYVASLIGLMCTAWMVLAGAQIVRDVGDMARFGRILFLLLAPLQLCVLAFLAALVGASGVAQEKDRRTLILLLMTRLTNHELVLGKLFASLLSVKTMLLAGVPVFYSLTLFGGVSSTQVVLVELVTLATVIAAGSLGCTVAFWREKTFQTLSITALAILIWMGLGEAANVAWGERVGEAVSPLRAVIAACRAAAWTSSSSGIYIAATLLGAAGLNVTCALWVRVWNPSRDVRPGQADAAQAIWGESAGEASSESERSRQDHIDARVRAPGKSRNVWDNPVLWREMCTWAYGRKVLLVRFGYIAFFVMTLAAAHLLAGDGQDPALTASTTRAPAVAKILAPFFLLSLVIVNALAVTSITNERDGQALDLLLVTDLSPKEFVLGKLLGVFWVTKEMVALPMALCIYLWMQDKLGGEACLLINGALVVMNVFVATMGIHCGMHYANSRSAIGVSLGAVFFLFLGVVTCMVVMISFSGSFQIQMAPFLVFILGGSVGLFVSLGVRNPSPAIATASGLLPFATFHAITSFMLGQPLNVFFVTTATYGFTIAAMLVPAISGFDIAMGRAKGLAND